MADNNLEISFFFTDYLNRKAGEGLDRIESDNEDLIEKTIILKNHFGGYSAVE